LSYAEELRKAGLHVIPGTGATTERMLRECASH
jgi:hypothetical protein